ncbi:hypothetical protein IE53DRAFT_410212 [Violaceomyces palustris]|uniref:Uncharacterized protein n=1 Tax=Violaceomyces palustris TaxID=1673888 RepID=A0ACD0P0C5_9BASI|nr:hypothetical protein IE53DRAFT_410212 [Violaceomyces palustris]
MVRYTNLVLAAALMSSAAAITTNEEPAQALLARTFGTSKNCWTPAHPVGQKPQPPWKPESIPGFCHGVNVPNVPSWNGGDQTHCDKGWKDQYCSHGNKPCPLPSGGQKPPTRGGHGSGHHTKTKPKQCPTPTKSSTITSTSTTTSTSASPTTTTTTTTSGGEDPICQGAYQQTFDDYTTVPTTGVYAGQEVGAATSDPSYMTYGLSTTVEGCLKICDETSGCVFVNVYQDQYPEGETPTDLTPEVQAKYKLGNLTCALFSKCVSTDQNTNYGGQNDPSFITDSNGYCKSGNCP